jgi:hypothetical protein
MPDCVYVLIVCMCCVPSVMLFAHPCCRAHYCQTAAVALHAARTELEERLLKLVSSHVDGWSDVRELGT